jgi:hypothetical protein
MEPVGGTAARILTLSAGLALCGVATPAAEVKEGPRPLETGPLRIQDALVLGIGFLDLGPAPAWILRPGQWQLDLALGVDNDFARSAGVAALLDRRTERQPFSLTSLPAATSPGEPGDYLVDVEHLQATVMLRGGVRRNLQLELAVPFVNVGGGFLDGTIEGFHNLFSIGQMGRLGLPRDAVEIDLRSARATLQVNAPPGPALGDVVVGATVGPWSPAAASPPGLAARVLLKLPTGSVERLTGSGSVDVGVQALATKCFPESCVHGSLGLAYLGAMERLGLPPQARLSGTLAYEHSLGSKTSVVAQLALAQSPFGGLSLDWLRPPSTLLTVGLKRRVGQPVLYLGVTENLRSFNNSPDFGVHVGVIHGFSWHTRPRP